MDFAILRIGYSTKLDVKFIQYSESALKEDLPIGIYIYSLATNTTDAINEANWVISTLKQLNLHDGDLSYPIFFDYEEESVYSNKTKTENTEIINAFLKVIFNNGFYGGLYMGAYAYLNHVNIDKINTDAVWIASYSSWNVFNNKYYRPQITMWQFDDGQYNFTGETIDGYTLGTSSKYVDQNYSFVDFPKKIISGGYNGFNKANIPPVQEENPTTPNTPITPNQTIGKASISANFSITLVIVSTIAFTIIILKSIKKEQI